MAASGTYSGGNITLPITNLSVATPVGIAAPPATDARFNVFVLALDSGVTIDTANINTLTAQ